MLFSAAQPVKVRFLKENVVPGKSDVQKLQTQLQKDRENK
jgi:hypothetical protein